MKTLGSKRFVKSLLRNRLRSDGEIDMILRDCEAVARTRARPKVFRGVLNGQYIRRKIPPRQTVPEVPKIPSPTGPAPKPLQSLPPKVEPTVTISSSTTVSQQSRRQHFQDSFSRFLEFLKLNGPVLIMNAGSFCTLMAFTRTDVLELRVLSVSGSVCFLIYTFAQSPIKWLTIGWTSLFATVNTWKIVQIVLERHSHVELTEEQEACFAKFFLPHGVTPKQFEVIDKLAQRIIGRYLTAASAAPVSPEEREGRDNLGGSWIGEMNFLEGFWEREQGKDDSASQPRRTCHAMYTVMAKEDCIVWKWSYANMEKLMKRSPDIRAALTRAMTSAIVGKVVNFTVSRSNARPLWQAWLDDFKHARIRSEARKSVAQSGSEGDVKDAAPENVEKDSPA